MQVVLERQEQAYGGRSVGKLIVQMDLDEFEELTGVNVLRDQHLEGREFEIKPEWNLRREATARRDELVRIGGLLGRLQADVQTMLEGLDAFEGISGKGKEPVEAGAAPEAEPM